MNPRLDTGRVVASALMQWKRRALDAARRTRLLDASGRLWGGDRVTVLAYHRVIEHSRPGFDTYRTNVSADPRGFEEQMQWLVKNFDPIGIGDLAAARRGGSLPDRPVLVTFDDGYRDNYDHAWPIARSLGVPLTIFLATDHVDTSSPFYWDLAAYCFHHSPRQEAFLPILGRRSLEDPRLVDEWIASAKALPESDKLRAVAQLPETLDVEVHDGAFDDTLLTWDQVKEMQAHGVDFGAHTCTHPILTKVDALEARRQILDSKAAVEERTGTAAIGFAYPNGLQNDFDGPAIDAVGEAGFELAFSLLPGPNRMRDIVVRPFQVRRTYVYWGDHLSRFVAKVNGLARMVARWR